MTTVAARPPLADATRSAWVIGAFAGSKLLLHLLTSGGYGYFRDELYYLACSDHLASGYVDHPPLSVLALWAARALLGDSLPALRLLPAVVGAATVALVGVLARALGGRSLAMALAMAGALAAPYYLSIAHVYSMNVFDIFFWGLAAWQVTRVGARPTTGGWLVLGLVLGLGLLNKISVLWLGAGIFAGLAATPERRLLATRGPWLAGVSAAVLFSPYVLWQIGNGWPTREFIRNATTEKMAAIAPLDFLAGQVAMMLPFALPLWLAGLGWLMVHPAAKRHRLLGFAYLVVLAILAASGTSRAGYLAPAYTWLFAAGGVAIEQWTSRPRRRWIGPAYVSVLIATGAAIAPLALPILPVGTYVEYARRLGHAPGTEERKELGALGQFYADMHGWDAIVTTVAGVQRRLPPGDAAVARILAPDYGVAGAIDLLGRRQGLAPALSGHNNYWLWGPGDWDGRVLIVIGGTEADMRAAFVDVERAGTIECGLCMPYENHRPVWVGRSLRHAVADVWPRLKHYD